MAQIMVTPAELKTAASTLREYNRNFRSLVENLEIIEGELNTSWEGEAKQTFHQAFNNDKAFFNAFASLIDNYCQTLESIATQYENAETKNLDTATTRTSV